MPNKTPLNHPAAEQAEKSVLVWDLIIRIFHWTLVLSFATAFISGEVHASALHVWVGYGICLLLAVRLYWGLFGSHYAKFRSFTFSVSETLAYVRSLRAGQPTHYLGHNPAGALMVFALLIFVATLITTGLLTLAAIDYEGPLLFLANSVSDEASYVFRDIHEFLPNLGLVLIAFHLLGVISGSIHHKENLVRAMITGHKVPPSVLNKSEREEL